MSFFALMHNLFIKGSPLRTGKRAVHSFKKYIACKKKRHNSFTVIILNSQSSFVLESRIKVFLTFSFCCDWLCYKSVMIAPHIQQHHRNCHVGSEASPYLCTPSLSILHWPLVICIVADVFADLLHSFCISYTIVRIMNSTNIFSLYFMLNNEEQLWCNDA